MESRVNKSKQSEKQEQKIEFAVNGNINNEFKRNLSTDEIEQLIQLQERKKIETEKLKAYIKHLQNKYLGQ